MLAPWLWLGCGAPEPPRTPLEPAVPVGVPTCDRAAFAVALDVGHGPEAPGATSARGRSEYAFNQDLADQLLATLWRVGFTGSFTLDGGGAPLSLSERPARAAQRGASVLLSLHHDSVQPHYLATWRHPGGEGQHADQFSGFSLWVSLANPRGEDNRALARALGEHLLAAGHRPTLHHAEDIPGERREVIDPDLGLYNRDTLAVLRLSTLPTVLVEAGVIVNREEELRLSDRAWRRAFAGTLVEGLDAYCLSSLAPRP